jgi:hypothetical protein
VFHKRLKDEALDMISHLLVYSPDVRFGGLEICAHRYFDDLRDPAARTPDGKPLPPLFDFSEDELRGCTPEMRAKLVPEWYRGEGAGAA